MNDRDLRALAHVVTAIRHDWDSQGIHAALRTATESGFDFGAIAHAATDAARTDTTKTPAGIVERLRGGWLTNAAYDRPTPTPPKIPKADTRRPSTPPTEAYLRAKEQLR